MQNDSAVSITLPVVPDAPQHTVVGDGLAESCVHNAVIHVYIKEVMVISRKTKISQKYMHLSSTDARRPTSRSMKLRQTHSVSVLFTIHFIGTGVRVYIHFVCMLQDYILNCISTHVKQFKKKDKRINHIDIFNKEIHLINLLS